MSSILNINTYMRYLWEIKQNYIGNARLYTRRYLMATLSTENNVTYLESVQIGNGIIQQSIGVLYDELCIHICTHCTLQTRNVYKRQSKTSKRQYASFCNAHMLFV